MVLKIYLKFKNPSYIFLPLLWLSMIAAPIAKRPTELNLHNLLSYRTVGPREGRKPALPLPQSFCGTADLREGLMLTLSNHDVTFRI
jgi:hypothetical protein